MNNITEYLKKAFEYKNSGDYKKAIDFFYKALALDNESSEIMYELAFLYSKLCQFDRAVSFYEQVILKNPDNLPAKFEYALLYKRMKELDKAEKILSDLFYCNYEINDVAAELFDIFSIKQEYKKIISFYNQRSNLLNTSINLYYAGLAYSKENKFELAEEFYKKSFNIDDNNIDSGINIAGILYEKGLFTESENILIKLLKYSENDKIYYLLAEINYQKPDIDLAIKYYSYAIKLNAKNALYYYKLGIAFSLKGLYNEAEESYSRAVNIETNNISYNYALAYLYYVNKKYSLAEKVVDFILFLDKKDNQALALKIILLSIKNEVVQASKIVNEFSNVYINDDFLYYAQSFYYTKLNMWEKAIELISKAIDINPESIEYKFEKAKCYYNIEEYSKALKICDDIISKNEKYIQAYILSAKIELKNTDYEKTLYNVRKILELDINSSEAYSIKGCVLLNRNQYLEAIENYKIAASIEPKNEKYYLNIADCYYKLKNYNDAYYFYKEASVINISNAEYYYRMAKCSIEKNDIENALVNFSVMRRLAPMNIKYITEYTDFLYKLNKKKTAITIIKTLIKNVSQSEQTELKHLLEKYYI